MKSFVKEAKVSSAITPTAGVAGTSDISGTTLDMAGFDSVACVIRLGAITASAVTTVKWQQDTDSGMGAAADLTGTSMTIADTDDDSIVITEVIKPLERYVRVYVDRATANAVIASAEYIQFNSRTTPVTQPSGTASEVTVGPAEGTA